MAVLHTWRVDPWIKYWGGFDQADIEVDRAKLVGMFLPVWDNRDIGEYCYTSLIRSMPENYPFGIIAIDAGSTDGTIEYFEQQMPTFTPGNCAYDIKGLCKATPQAGIELWLGEYDKEADRFEKEDRIGHICWLHSDMDFVDNGWLGRVVDYLDSDPTAGLCCPCEPGEHDDIEGEFEANRCPLVIPVRTIKALYREFGYFIDPNLWHMIGYCDWDLHRRLQKLGLRSLVTKRASVRHYGMRTRGNLHGPAFDDAHRENAELYFEKWDTNDPPI